MNLRLAGRESPYRPKPGYVLRRDLIEWTVAPAVIGAADHQPVVSLRILEPIPGDGRIIPQHRGHRPGRRLLLLRRRGGRRGRLRQVRVDKRNAGKGRSRDSGFDIMKTDHLWVLP